MRLRMLHRVGGPIACIEASTTAPTGVLMSLNAELADATILSPGSASRSTRELGLEAARSAWLRNTVDPAIFFPRLRVDLLVTCA